MPETITSLADAHAVFDALRVKAGAAGLFLRAPPPAPTSCCGRGCNGCVWEGWYAAANHWRDEAVRALATSNR